MVFSLRPFEVVSFQEVRKKKKQNMQKGLIQGLLTVGYSVFQMWLDICFLNKMMQLDTSDGVNDFALSLESSCDLIQLRSSFISKAAF